MEALQDLEMPSELKIDKLTFFNKPMCELGSLRGLGAPCVPIRFNIIMLWSNKKILNVSQLIATHNRNILHLSK